MEAITFGTGRESMLALLRAMNYQPGDEIILQGYTCIVMSNAIHTAGLVAVYADIDKDTLNFNLEALKAAITPKTRAIVCQNTFGIPGDTQALRKVCDEHQLLLIEDCAHMLPDVKGPATVGKYGDTLLASFSRDKAFSGVSGGAMLTRHPAIAAALRKEQEGAVEESLGTIFALLQYPLLYAIVRPLYGMVIGKAILVVAAKIKLLIPATSKKEKEGIMSPVVHKMPGACAVLALQQLQKLEEINDHRRMLTNTYVDFGVTHKWPLLSGIEYNLPLQKFPIFTRGANAIRAHLKTLNIHLNDGWNGCVICPETTDIEDAGYTEGQDPSAEEVSEAILNLPTHPGTTKEQALELAALLDPLLSK